MLKLLLLLLKGAKFGPLLKTGGTMLLSVGLYTLVFGVWYAVGAVLLMFVHELGHFIAARRLGLRAGMPMFIPFLGAWTQIKDVPVTVTQTAAIGFGGPFLGTVGAAIVLALALALHSPLLMALAYFGFFLNLVNLMPILPFDGGHIVALLSPRLWLLGAPLLLAFIIWARSPFLVIFLVLILPSAWQAMRAAWHGIAPEGHPRYYDVPQQDRIKYGAYYLMLVIFLGVMTVQTHTQVEALRSAL